LIVRWRGQDILSGATDVEVYPSLKERDMPLYLHQSIHLKLFILSDGTAIHTSANLTMSGLGLSDRPNIEAGCTIGLTMADWNQVYGLLGECTRVNDDIYAQALEYYEKYHKREKSSPPFQIACPESQQFSILSLPATESPSRLHALYASDEPIPAGSVAAFMHDISLYRVPPGLQEDVFYAFLRESFIGQPFTQAIVALVKATGSARFGLVNEWLQTNCSDKPTPYRWELKPATRRLYSWLQHFYEEVSWDRPHHSMVIRWTDKPKR